MTTAPLKFAIDRAAGTVRVSGIPATTTVSLASNISFVQFDAAQAAGSIIYNDRPQLPEIFTDPSPYQSYINAWITAQAALAVNPLTLAQARAVKCALVQAIFAVKRSNPVSVTVSGTPYQWSITDLAVMATLSGYLYVSPVNNVISDLNSKVGSLVSAMETTLTNNASAANSFATNLQTALNTWVSALNSAESSVTSWASPGNVSVPAGGEFAVTTSFSNVSSVSAPTMQLVPYGGTAAVTVTTSDVSNIMTAIANQTATESIANANKQAAVNALSTIAAVAAYDATTGW